MHKTRIRLYPLLKKAYSQKNKSVYAPIQFTDKLMSWQASICMKHEIGLNFETISAEKHCNITKGIEIGSFVITECLFYLMIVKKYPYYPLMKL